MKKLLLILICFIALGVKAQIPCFNTAVNYNVGSLPTSIASADFNADGKIDLVVCNQGSDSIHILMGTGIGTFSLGANYFVTNQPACVVCSDFNGDGTIDLAVANQGSNNVSILLGTGTGSFGSVTNFNVQSYPSFIVSSDINGDGKKDLVVANNSASSISILLGTGTGSFGVATNLPLGVGPNSLLCADFNADGNMDIAVIGGGSSNVYVFIATAPGVYGASTNFAVGSNPYWLTSGDFNLDGKADLAVSNQGTNNVSVLLGIGTGTFSTATNFPTESSPGMIINNDFNGDGKIDLAMVNPPSDTVSVLMGTGTGSFGTATVFPVGTYPYFICANDFNGDGKIDLATANEFSSASILINCIVTSSCYSSPDGIDGTSGWSYKDYIIPTGYKLDSVKMDATRPGYLTQDEDFVLESCQGTTVYNSGIATLPPFSNFSDLPSDYNIWHDVTSYNYASVGMVRVSLPVNAGAIWNNLCVAISPQTPTEIKENDYLGTMKIFPNPNNGTFNIDILKSIGHGEIAIYDCLGKEMFRQNISKGNNLIESNQLSRGMYFYSVFENKQKIKTAKLIID
jgi:hypothetical protein